MHALEHLFLVGEFPERTRLLSGLTLAQVTLRPDGASHSIYEELWHVVAYQESIVGSGDPNGDRYPSTAPEHEQQWHDRAAAADRRVAAVVSSNLFSRGDAEDAERRNRLSPPRLRASA